MSCAEPPPCRQRPNEEASCSTFDRRRHGGRRHSFGFPGSLVSARMRPKSVGVCMCSKLAGGNNLTYVGFGLPWGCSAPWQAVIDASGRGSGHADSALVQVDGDSACTDACRMRSAACQWGPGALMTAWRAPMAVRSGGEKDGATFLPVPASADNLLVSFR